MIKSNISTNAPYDERDRNLIVVRSELLPLSETFVKQQMVGLRSWQATLVGHSLTKAGLDLAGLKVHLLGFALDSPLRRIQWRLFTRLGMLPPASLQGLLSRHGALRPRLAHVHFGTDAVAAWPWLQWLRVPVVVTLHGYDIHTHPQWWESGQAGSWMKSYPRKLRKLSSRPQVSFIAVSDAVRQRAIDAYGIPPSKIKTLHIGVDTDVFSPAATPVGERKPCILFVGRLVEKKGVSVLVKAMELVGATFPDARAVIVGDGPELAMAERLASEVGAKVTFLGSQSNNTVRELLRDAYVFCLPSVISRNGDAEGLPISILEAQASGVPVVTSAIGGRDEGIVDGVTGLAFGEHDHVALANRLCRLLGDPALATRMGLAARAFAVGRFSLAQCTQALECHYSERAQESVR